MKQNNVDCKTWNFGSESVEFLLNDPVGLFQVIKKKSNYKIKDRNEKETIKMNWYYL